MTSTPAGWNPVDLPGQIIDEGWSGRIVDPGTGAGLFTANTNYNVVGVDPLTGGPSPIGTDVGFGAAVRRWVQAGVYNGDFAVSPNATGSPVDDEYNNLPYWSFQPTQSGQIIAYVEPRSGAGFDPTAFDPTAFQANTSGISGTRQLRFQMIGGGYTTDDAYLTQLVPVTTTADEVYELEAGFSFVKVPDTDADAKVYISVTFLQGNLLSSTASPNYVSVEAGITTDTKATHRTPSIAIPDDAAYARVSIGLKRGTSAVTNSAEVAISEVFLAQRERYEGTAFPANPRTGQRAYRSDIRGGLWFRWDGTYWLSEQLFICAVSQWDSTGFAVTSDSRLARPDPDYDVYVYEWWADMHVLTTNTTSHYWTLDLKSSTGSYAAFPTLSTSGNTASTTTRERGTVNALAGFTTDWLQFHATKVGSPGNLFAPAAFTYRLRAT